MSIHLLRGVVALAGAMNGTIEGRIRLQKSAYLLKRLGVPDFQDAPFRYHHYGPYSRPLSYVLHDSVVSGLLQEDEQEHGEELVRYSYALTDAGRKWLESAQREPDPVVAKAAPLLQAAHYRTLELAATLLFIEHNERIPSRDESMRRALELKPACADHRSDARNLLEQLGL